VRSARAGRTEHARDRWQRTSVRAAVVARLARVAYLAPVALSAALPWAWFAVRDAIGPVTDVLAIALPAVVVLVAAAAVVGAVRRGRPRWLVPAASVLALGGAAVLGPWLPEDTGPVAPGRAVTVVGANVMGTPEAADELLALQADVLVVSEATDDLAPALVPAYPYRERAVGGPEVAVYSRLPLRLLETQAPDLPGLRLEVAGPAGPFVLYALHVPRPWFTTVGAYQATVTEHHGIMRALAGRVSGEALPVVVTGDLNTPDRGRDYREVLRDGGLVDAMRDGWGGYTSTGQWAPLLLRIDHVLVSTGWCGDAPRRVPLPGSDHRAVAASVGPCNAAGTEPPLGSAR
jgi:endonuclease/exonuclease/phosphatase (EEP) superfamily protein YafD